MVIWAGLAHFHLLKSISISSIRNCVRKGLKMAKLTAAARKHIAPSKFGVPSKAPKPGSYPMPDRSHAVNAMARASGKAVEAQVRAKAHKLYPGLKAKLSSLKGK